MDGMGSVIGGWDFESVDPQRGNCQLLMIQGNFSECGMGYGYITSCLLRGRGGGIWNPEYLGVFEGVLGCVFRECEEMCVDGWICGSFDR